MKNISIWAKINPKKAISLIIFFEVLKLSIGTAIGYDFLPDLPNFVVEFSIFSLVLLITFTETNYKINSIGLNKTKLYAFRTKSSAILFYGSFLLSILFGNFYQNIGYSTDNQLSVSASVSVRTDSTSQSEVSQDTEKKLNKILLLKNKNSIISRKAQNKESNEGGRRILYFFLFVLGLALTFFGLYLTCALACGNYAVYAILTLLVSLGVFSGGIYFLMKVFRKEIVPYREMDKTAKRKEWKKYLLTLLSIIGLLGIYILFQNFI